MPGAVLARTCPGRQTLCLGAGAQVLPLRGPGSAEGTTMQELRLVAVSEDGSYAVLAVPGRGGRFSLPIDDRLRTVARGQFSRLAQYEIEVESPLRPKEIQDRIRAGQTADEIADAAGIPIERVRRFEGPVLAERAYRAQEAQQATVRGPGDSGPGPRLGEIVTERLTQSGTSPDDAQWDSRKRPDGNWQVQLMFMTGNRPQMAEWVFDPRRRHASPADDNAARLCLSGPDVPPGRIGAPDTVTATVTPIASRLAAQGAHAAESRWEAERAQARAVPSAPGRGAAASPGRAAAGRAAPDTPGRAAPAPAAKPAPKTAPEPAAATPAASATDGKAAAVAGDHQESPAAPARERPARKAAGSRSRRASVPSWDEIMLGNSRQPD
jgi:Protein of unknown function (DUF3071)